MADDEVRLLAEAKKLPMVDRVAHANWKARNAAYEDIKLACQRVYEDTDPCLAEYGAHCPFSRPMHGTHKAACKRMPMQHHNCLFICFITVQGACFPRRWETAMRQPKTRRWTPSLATSARPVSSKPPSAWGGSACTL